MPAPSRGRVGEALRLSKLAAEACLESGSAAPRSGKAAKLSKNWVLACYPDCKPLKIQSAKFRKANFLIASQPFRVAGGGAAGRRPPDRA